MGDLFSTRALAPARVEFASDSVGEVCDAPEIGGQRIVLDGGELLFSEKFFPEKISNRMLEYLQENRWLDWKGTDWTRVKGEQLDSIEFCNINWKQDYIKFFGKTHPLPRLTSWYGDPGAAYSYSGIKSDPNPWNKGLIYLRDALERALSAEFNSVLLNWYRDGNDSLSWHADDEPELGPEPIIASVSFGEAREFLFRRRDSNKTALSLTLTHGSLVVMKGKTQENWVHSVPKRKGVKKSRFNLTFRRIS